MKALAYPCDLESNEDLSALPVQVFDSLGSLDILVHAGALVNAVEDAHWSVKQKDQSYDIWAKPLTDQSYVGFYSNSGISSIDG